MAEIIGLPKLSPTMEEGVLVRWVKKEGDAVEPGDLIAEVETDKANMDFNLEDEGVLLKLLVEEGDTVKLGAPVAIIGQEGEDVSELIEKAQSVANGDAKAAETASQEARDDDNAEADSDDSDEADSVQRDGDDDSAEAESDQRDGDDDSTKDLDDKSPRQSQSPNQQSPTSAKSKKKKKSAASSKRKERLLASPLAKTLALELGIDIRDIEGSGPGGRIVERDVQEAAEQGQSSTSRQDATQGEASQQDARDSDSHADSTSAAIVTGDGSRYRDEPLSNVRKRIAERMVEAKQMAPHFYLTRDIAFDALLAFRKRVNELLGDRGKVSVNDLIVKACALALRKQPSCNAAFMGEYIRYYQDVHIGIAVAADHGLITPVVRNADLKGLSIISEESKELAERARNRQLKMHEIQGSTFTVSNLGMFGIREFAAIINPPEGAILAVGAARDIPTLEDRKLVNKKVMTVTLSCDHRVIDGALGAKFLAELADLIETPELLSL